MNNENILETYLKSVETNHLIEKQHVSQTTIKTYRDRLRLFFNYIGDKPLSKVMTMDIKAYLADCVKKDIKPATLKARLSALKAMYKELSDPEYGLEIYDMANCIKSIKNTYSHKRPVEKEDLNKIVEYVKIRKSLSDLCMRNYLFVQVLRFYGLRVSSALNIKACDIVFEDKGIRLNYISKGNKERSKLMPYMNSDGDLMEQVELFGSNLKAHIEKIDSGLIFLTKTGNEWSYCAALKVFKKVCSECGFAKKNYTPHSIRHSFVSHKLAAGVPLQTVSNLADHANTFITASIYSKAEDSETEAAMAIGLI